MCRIRNTHHEETTMCDTKSLAETKIDKLTLAMHRLASAMENFSAANPGHGHLHGDAGHLSGFSRTNDLAAVDATGQRQVG